MRFILPSFAIFLFGVTVNATSFSGSGGAAHHCMIREEDHTLWCWGQNEKGQLEIGNNEVQYKPIKVDLGKAMEALNGLHFQTIPVSHTPLC